MLSLNGCNIQLYADDTTIYTAHLDMTVIESILSANMDVIKDWLDKNSLIINLKKRKTKNMLFGTDKRLYSHNNLKVKMQGNVINFTDEYNYLGLHLDPLLSMSNDLNKMLRKTTGRIKLLARLGKSLSVLAAKVVYNEHVLPTLLYCSSPVLKISETMPQKFETFQHKVYKVIYHRIQER